MLQVRLTEPSMIQSVISGTKKQVTAQLPFGFQAQDESLILSYSQNDAERTIGIAKIKSFTVINGGIVPAGSPYSDAEDWARAEGFDSFWDACKWFTEKHGSRWQERTWGIIQFEGTWKRGGEV